MGREVDSDNLISAAEVQVILRLSHSNSVTTYLKRYADFPRPVVEISESKIRLWLREDIEHWKDNREARS